MQLGDAVHSPNCKWFEELLPYCTLKDKSYYDGRTATVTQFGEDVQMDELSVSLIFFFKF